MRISKVYIFLKISNLRKVTLCIFKLPKTIENKYSSGFARRHNLNIDGYASPENLFQNGPKIQQL